MNNRTLAAGIAALSLVAASGAHAADEAELKALKSEIDSLKHDYESRIQSLEERLKKAEAKSKSGATQTAKVTAPPPIVLNAAGKPMAVPPLQATTVAAAAPGPATPMAPIAPPPVPAPLPPAPMPARAPSSINTFNPGISAVLNGMAFGSRRDPAAQKISGFAVPGEAGLPDRGFSIGESEFAMFANIDPYMKAWLDVSFDKDNQPTIEEAYIQSLNLGGGLNVKAGRFLSSIGYLNERHAHDWQFSDAPLPYRVFLNNQYGDDGVQVRWLAPTDIFLEAGAEWFRGAEYPASGSADGGKGAYTGFVHIGSDIGQSASWFGGLSYMHSRADGRVDVDPVTFRGNSFSGRDDLGIASFVFKYAPNGNFAQHKLTLTGEYFYDVTNGTYEILGPGASSAIDLKRNGWYAQAAIQFRPRWTFGARLSQLNGDDVPGVLVGSLLDPDGHKPTAVTGLLEFDTSEFGRFRLQYTRDESSRATNDEILFQYTVIYGPHPAHRY